MNEFITTLSPYHIRAGPWSPRLPIKGFPLVEHKGHQGLRALAVAPTALPQSGQGPSSPINPTEPHPTCYHSIMTTARQTPSPSSSLPSTRNSPLLLFASTRNFPLLFASTRNTFKDRW